MIRVEHVEVFNFEGAIRGLRNPMNSWDKSDSFICDAKHCDGCTHQDKDGDACWKNPDGIVIGKNDLDLMHRLYKAGTEHRKYLRQIFVSMDITAPLYWWKEMDQYRINVTTNSCSTMHKIHAKEFEPIDFSIEHIYNTDMFGVFNTTLAGLNVAREEYLKTKDKKYWWYMIQLLPSSYNQKRTITMNYENVINIIKQRSNHRLDEWREFCDILSKLPHLDEITTKQNDKLDYTE